MNINFFEVWISNGLVFKRLVYVLCPRQTVVHSLLNQPPACSPSSNNDIALHKHKKTRWHPLFRYSNGRAIRYSNGRVIGYSNGIQIPDHFDIQPLSDHLNTTLVQYSDPNCICFQTTYHTTDYNYSCSSLSLYAFPNLSHT